MEPAENFSAFEWPFNEESWMSCLIVKLTISSAVTFTYSWFVITFIQQKTGKLQKNKNKKNKQECTYHRNVPCKQYSVFTKSIP